MEILTIDMMRKQLRIDYALNKEEEKEQERVLTDCAEKAEKKAQELMNRTFADINQEYGKMPVQIIHICLILAEEEYMNRRETPYTIDMMIAPFMLWVSISELRWQIKDETADANLLRTYERAAIELTTKVVNRTTSEILSINGFIPRNMKKAIIVAVKTFWKNKQPTPISGVYKMPYEYDELLKDFIKL